ncbi:MAG: TonB family protein [Pseudomonadota bacterium]
MALVRWLIGAPLALAVTGFLFLFMAAMVSQSEAQLAEPRPAPEIIITRQIQQEPIVKDPPTRPNTPRPPDIEIPPQQSGSRPTVVETTPPETSDPTGIIDPGGPGAAPIIRIAPPYPERCRNRNAQGTVVVQFDVGADGTVQNVTILESADACLNRAVIKAVSGWKYPPAMAAGKAAPRRGVTERFSFTLTDG